MTRLKKEIEIKTIGDSVNRTAQLQEQNKRLSQENQRLRDEISARDIELANQGAPGYTKAHFVDKTGGKTTEEKLELSLAENKRLHDENERLRAALDETHQIDTGSRFKDSQLTGSMIEGFKDAKSKKWALTRNEKAKKKEAIKRKANETDDNKLLSLEEVADV